MTAPKRLRQRGFALYMGALLLLMIIPMIGLALDSTLLYVVKTRLQGAVDGAALAGAKALSHGTDSTSEKTAAILAAQTYIKLNYPSSFFFSQDVVLNSTTGVQIDETVAYQRTVTVTATVVEPTLFMQWLHFMSNTVGASASTIRKDVNIMMVIDRSGSLATSGSCTPMIAAAQNFVGQFSPGNDNVGIVTFASTTFVNFALATTFQSASPNADTILGDVTCAGSTSTAYALWTAYQQLVALNQPGALNAILLFTDGDPTGVYVNMPIKNASPCTAYTSGNPSGPGGYTLPSGTHGYIPGLENEDTGNKFYGLLAAVGTAGGNGQQIIPSGDNALAPNSNNCAYSGTNNEEVTTDFYGVPTKDVNGNSLDTSYQGPVTKTGSFISMSNQSNSGWMCLNAADSAATNIRNGVTDQSSGHSLSGVITFSIGLGNAATPPNADFLERVANDPRSSIYDSTKPAGLYVYAATSADLQAAFAAVASEILRLAK
jgi:Flp pilus assembly protein TadG